MNKLIFIFLVIICCSLGAKTQNKDDFNLVLKTINLENIKLKNESNIDYKLDLFGYLPFLFTFYKSFLSSQDFNSCVYYPSCSNYAVQAIQKKGIFYGGIMTFDRLVRCNPSSVKQYNFDIKTKKLQDVIE